MEIPAARIGDSQHDSGEIGGIGSEKHTGDFGNGCAGGHDVINNDETSTTHRFGIEESKCAADVLLAGGMGAQLRLAGRIADAFDGPKQFQTGTIGEPAGEHVGLVVPPPELTPKMQRNGNERIGVSQQLAQAMTTPEAVRKRLGESPSAGILHSVNQLAEGLVEYPETLDSA